MLALKDDHWTKAAMASDALVVELLLRLKDSRAATSSSSSQLLQSRFTAKSVLPGWGKLMPRSKAATASRCEAVWIKSRKSKKDDSTTRCSPATPLSWSGGSGSPSGTADGFEESSRPRSKGNATYESTSTTKRGPRKKKSYDELKEEETSLLNERTDLRKEIATLQTSFKEHRAKNVNLKRAKIDLNLHSSAANLSAYFDRTENTISSQAHQRTTPPSFRHFPSHFYSHATTPYIHPYPQLDSCDESGNNSFVLPDLNMVPSEEDSASEILYGMS